MTLWAKTTLVIFLPPFFGQAKLAVNRKTPRGPARRFEHSALLANGNCCRGHELPRARDDIRAETFR